MDRNQKNILFITNLHLWSLGKGKGGRAFINTVEGYINAGWNVWFISSGGGIPPELLAHVKLFEKSYHSIEKLWLSKNKIVSVFFRFLKMFLLNKFYIETGSKILSKNKNKKFIIYAYEVDAVYAAKRISRKFNYPLVTRFQGTIHNDTPDNFNNLIRKAPSLQAYKTSAHLTIMTNDGTQGLKTLQRFGNKSGEIVFWRNGVNKISDDLLLQRKQLRKCFDFDDNFVFLTVSRLVDWKKVDRAINAFAVVNKEYSNARLVIIGDGEAKNNLMFLTKELQLNDKVVFKGAVEQDVVSKYMVAADAFLSFYNISNVGNPLMEAMMCGKPIITLDVGDTSELIKNGENGILLSLDNLSQISHMMNKIIEDKEFRDNLSMGALKTAHREFWNWDDRISAEISKVSLLLEGDSN